MSNPHDPAPDAPNPGPDDHLVPPDIGDWTDLGDLEPVPDAAAASGVVLDAEPVAEAEPAPEPGHEPSALFESFAQPAGGDNLPDASLSFDLPEPAGDGVEHTMGAAPEDIEATRTAPAPEAEAVDLGEDLPLAESASAAGSGLLLFADEIPPAAAGSGILPLADEVPLAGSASSSGLLPLAEEVPVPADAPDGPLAVLPADAPTSDEPPLPVADLDDVFPVAPASGWVGDDPSSRRLKNEGRPAWANWDPSAEEAAPPPAAPADAGLSGTDLFDALPVPAAGPSASSDIFAGQFRKPKDGPPAADVSDVIAATAFRPGQAPPGGDPPPDRSSEVLVYGAPVGGSTIDSAPGLPLAEELPDPMDALFSGDGPADAGPPAAPTGSVADLDLGPVHAGPGASSILSYHDEDGAGSGDKYADATEVAFEDVGDLGEVGGPAPEGGFAFERPAGDGGFDLTVDDDGSVSFDLGDDAPLSLRGDRTGPGSDGGPTDWRAQTGSDLFARDRRPPGAPDLVGGDSNALIDPGATAEEPLEVPPSSIFSGGKPGGPPESGGSADVRLVPSDSEMAAAGRGSPADPHDPLSGTTPMDALPAAADEDGRVSFDMGEFAADQATQKSLYRADDDEDAIDWNMDASEESPSLSAIEKKTGAPPSGILGRRGKPAAGDPAAEDVAFLDDGGPASGGPKPDPSSAFGFAVQPGTGDWSGFPAPAAAGGNAKRPGEGSSEVSVAYAPPAGPSPSFTMDIVHDVDGLKSGVIDPSDAAQAAAAATIVPSSVARGRRRAADDDGDDTTGTTAAAAARRGGGGKGWVGGTLLGLVLGLGAGAGAYFLELLPPAGGPKPLPPVAQNTKTAPKPNDGPPPAAAPPATVAGGQAALDGGDPVRALVIFEQAGGDTPAAKAGRGHARLLSRLRELAVGGTAPAADDEALTRARADLQAAAADDGDDKATAARAALHLGVLHEASGDHAAARKAYEDGRAKFPGSAAWFEAALDRLDATAPADAPKGEGRRPAADAERAARLALLVVLLQGPPATAAAAVEPGAYFWKAVNAAKAGKFDAAVEQIKLARTAHEARRLKFAGAGLNPVSDPLEQIFTRACDDLQAYWEVRRGLSDHPTVGPLVQKEGFPKAVDTLSKSADLLAKADEKVGLLEKDLTGAKEMLAKLQTDLKAEKDGVTKLQSDLKAEKDAVAKLEADYKTAADAVAKAKADLKAAADKLAAAEAAATKLDETVTAVSKELQAGKFLADKADAGMMLAAVKAVVDRASGPNLASLLPSPMAAVGGAGLTAAQVVDLADRVAKSDAAAKAAADRLAAETKRLTDAKDTEVKATAARYEAEVKATKDAAAAAVKKADDARAAAEAAAAAKLAAETKALRDAADRAAAKSRADLAAAEAAFREQIRGAKSAAETLDLWLPLVTDLQRPADADAAIADADKVLATSAADSDDRGKALAVKAAAQLLKGDPASARASADAARAVPAYDRAKAWGRAADAVAALVRDPLAPKRLEVSTRPDARQAARHLDAGVRAYRAGRWADAEAALRGAVAADPADPVGWYFLGAARWSQGKAEEARADFAQGGERERRRPVPARQIDNALAPITRPAREAIAAVR